jgi:hypothetical protein
MKGTHAAAPSAIPEEWTEPEDVCLGKIFAAADIQRPAAPPESPSGRRLQRGTQHLLVSKLFVCLVALLCIQPLATQPERKDDRVPSCAGSAVLRHGHHLRGTVHAQPDRLFQRVIVMQSLVIQSKCIVSL